MFRHWKTEIGCEIVCEEKKSAPKLPQYLHSDQEMRRTKSIAECVKCCSDCCDFHRKVLCSKLKNAKHWTYSFYIAEEWYWRRGPWSLPELNVWISMWRNWPATGFSFRCSHLLVSTTKEITVTQNVSGTSLNPKQMVRPRMMGNIKTVSINNSSIHIVTFFTCSWNCVSLKKKISQQSP